MAENEQSLAHKHVQKNFLVVYSERGLRKEELYSINFQDYEVLIYN